MKLGTTMSLLRLLISEIALRAEVRYAPIHTFALTAAEVVFRFQQSTYA